MKKLVEKVAADESAELFHEEVTYAKKHELLKEDHTILVKDSKERFRDAYVEKGLKETEESFEADVSLLEQPLSYLLTHKDTFLYVESKWFEVIGVDAISIEVDDVFGTYDLMLGLKLQKKFQSSLKAKLEKNLSGDETKFDLMFDAQEGLWNVNIALNGIPGYNEGMKIREAYDITYAFLFHLVETLEDNQ
jgi:hypothetical protein